MQQLTTEWTDDGKMTGKMSPGWQFRYRPPTEAKWAVTNLIVQLLCLRGNQTCTTAKTFCAKDSMSQVEQFIFRHPLSESGWSTCRIVLRLLDKSLVADQLSQPSSFADFRQYGLIHVGPMFWIINTLLKCSFPERDGKQWTFWVIK